MTYAGAVLLLCLSHTGTYSWHNNPDSFSYFLSCGTSVYTRVSLCFCQCLWLCLSHKWEPDLMSCFVLVLTHACLGSSSSNWLVFIFRLLWKRSLARKRDPLRWSNMEARTEQSFWSRMPLASETVLLWVVQNPSLLFKYKRSFHRRFAFSQNVGFHRLKHKGKPADILEISLDKLMAFGLNGNSLAQEFRFHFLTKHLLVLGIYQ